MRALRRINENNKVSFLREDVHDFGKNLKIDVKHANTVQRWLVKACPEDWKKKACWSENGSNGHCK